MHRSIVALILQAGNLRRYTWAQVVLRDGGRWQFLNTLFSVSEACLYMQMVDRNDQGAFESLPSANSYEGLHNLVVKIARLISGQRLRSFAMVGCGYMPDVGPLSAGQSAIPHTRRRKAEGAVLTVLRCCYYFEKAFTSLGLLSACLQAEIIKDPARFVERDPAMARTLIDQREAVGLSIGTCLWNCLKPNRVSSCTRTSF